MAYLHEDRDLYPISKRLARKTKDLFDIVQKRKDNEIK